MTTWNLRLLSFPENYGETPIGLGPKAYIAIKHPSDTIKYKNGKYDIEFETISPDCATFGVLEREVIRLVKELGTIKKQGKKFFENQEEKKRDYLARKSKLD